jgi:hypothetical protein
MAQDEQGKPAPQIVSWALYLIKELGLTTALVAFVCYLLAVEMPAMRQDFRLQTDKLVEAVGNNSRVMVELSAEVRALRRERAAREP